METETVVVKKSRNGKSVFAKVDFASGEQIYEVVGKFINGDIDEDLEDSVRDNTYRYDAKRYISPQGTIGDFFNHSCEPNAKIVKKGKQLFIVALVDIKAGDEIVFDYSTIIASDDVWEMKCNCGTKSCRGIIGQFSMLPKQLQKQYITKGMVPKYILD